MRYSVHDLGSSMYAVDADDTQVGIVGFGVDVVALWDESGECLGGWVNLTFDEALSALLSWDQGR